MHRAGDIFPLDPHVRGSAIGYLASVSSRVPAVFILPELEHALANDPWAPDLLIDKERIDTALKGQ